MSWQSYNPMVQNNFANPRINRNELLILAKIITYPAWKKVHIESKLYSYGRPNIYSRSVDVPTLFWMSRFSVFHNAHLLGTLYILDIYVCTMCSWTLFARIYRQEVSLPLHVVLASCVTTIQSIQQNISNKNQHIF